jgi:hypothetical protein
MENNIRKDVRTKPKDTHIHVYKDAYRKDTYIYIRVTAVASNLVRDDHVQC